MTPVSSQKYVKNNETSTKAKTVITQYIPRVYLYLPNLKMENGGNLLRKVQADLLVQSS